MVLLAATTGLRRSELFALKWGDIDFMDRLINISLSIYGQVIGSCKTETSQKTVPLAPHVVVELSLWKEESRYQETDDWCLPALTKTGSCPIGQRF